MILKVFSIYDDKARSYLPPFMLPERGMAIRAFSDCINSDTHQFGANPGDYTLFELCEFDDATAEFINLDSRNLCGNGLSYVAPDGGTFPVSGGNSSGPSLSEVVDIGVDVNG